MPDSDSLEIYCPNCRHYVVPLKAAVNWYCPRCAWQFTDADIVRERPQQPPSEQAGPPSGSSDGLAADASNARFWRGILGRLKPNSTSSAKTG